MNKSPFSVSVVIPTFNRSHILERALRSVLGQTVAAREIIREIIVVDDGSTDDTASLVQAQFPEIKLIRQENKGVSAARNHGIRCADSEWIAFLDSDDEWLPNKLELQLVAAKRHPDILLWHGDEIWIRKGKRVNPRQKHAKSGGWIFQLCLPLCCISPSATMIKKSVFEEIGWFNEALPACEDYEFWLRFCAKHPVGFVAEKIIKKYGGHHDQLSIKYWGMDRFRIESMRRVLLEYELHLEDKKALIEEMKFKINVMKIGAEKHKNEGLSSWLNQVKKEVDELK